MKKRITILFRCAVVTGMIPAILLAGCGSKEAAGQAEAKRSEIAADSTQNTDTDNAETEDPGSENTEAENSNDDHTEEELHRSDITEDMITYYRGFEDLLLKSEYEQTAVTDIEWRDLPTGEELAVSVEQPVWAYMTLAEKYPVNPFVLLGLIEESGFQSEYNHVSERKFELLEIADPSGSNALIPVMHLWTEPRREYSAGNCENILETIGIFTPVYEAEDCLYCYFGSCRSESICLNSRIAAVYFFPNEDKTEIARAELQFFFEEFSPAVLLHGGWAGHSVSQNMVWSEDLLYGASIMAALELNIAGETDVLTKLCQGDGIVPESYVIGDGASGMRAEQHLRQSELGTVLNYSLYAE